ncbi:hypothetical protein KEM48_003891 [Puccinia striiformis f. sp. tritici PST-130]|nr:hypothetical protein KEM48_003891 [Puccinia striiformis f. sp. tritici PST-130]
MHRAKRHHVGRDPQHSISVSYPIVVFHHFHYLQLDPTPSSPDTIPPRMQSIQFLSVLVAVILHSQSATAIVPIFRCDGHGERTAPYCIQPGTETQYLSESYPFFGMQFIKGLNSTAAAQDTRRAAAPVAEQIYLSSTSPLTLSTFQPVSTPSDNQ